MNIRKWQKPGSDEVRYYLDMRHDAPFLSHSANRLLDGRWIGRDDDGIAHVYAKARPYGVCRTEDGPWLDEALLWQNGAPVTFETWEKTFAACQTKGGNFSVAKYMKWEG